MSPARAHRRAARLMASAALAFAASPCLADADLPRIDTASIGGGSLAGVQGRIAVNISAGLMHRQANAAAIAAGAVAAPSVSVRQTIPVDAPRATALESRSTIGSDVFTGASGLVSVNQTSGELNRQANSVSVGLSGSAGSVADEQLASVSSGIPQPGLRTPIGGSRTAGVDDTAFLGARGVVQVNQAAGALNVSANILSLRALGLVNPSSVHP